MAARSVMQRTQCSDGGGKIAARPAPPGKLARTARVAGSGPTKTQGATHYYSAALSALGGFYFFSHTSGTSIAYCACHTDLDMGPRRDHNDCMDMGLVHCSELGDFFSGAVGWLPCRQIFSGIFAGTLAPAAAIRYSSFVGWSLVSQS